MSESLGTPRSQFTVGTRGSALAVTQSTATAQLLEQASGLGFELIQVKTEGDIVTGPLAQLGGTGVFAAALRVSLLEGKCDLAVHSLKDLPTAQPEGLVIATVPERADVRDALCARDGLTLDDLPTNAKVGTGSPRRAAQLLAARPDLTIVDIRGNVPTRLARVFGEDPSLVDVGVGGELRSDLDAVVLATAGLERLGLERFITERLDPSIVLPAPGQGALAIECRPETALNGDLLSTALHTVENQAARWEVTAERALLGHLEAGCAAPIGALGRFTLGSEHSSVSVAGELVLEAVACSPDGSRMMRRRAQKTVASLADVRALGVQLATELLDAGAADIAGLTR
ncbi:hydroxymethylbilane synthase [Neomicrococcus aestuarii]|uniref:Hydroxymethylbilane synthase n=1 Tax=Neomicrococcus aestuarii TaxID=556325 RepID=A0A7W8TVI5_9MICC|nr:hydroxymethylbilane synthase [Neomicrococcus aestuarii]MBB5513690.1 hydroxymethylbilane synthase [Neomicrococcus aestuarii]